MTKAGHADRAHAKLSASGSYRWIGCPGSVRLEENIPDQQTAYSQEGTLAHELSELKLKLSLGWIAEKEFNTLKNNLGEIPKEMDRFTNQYVEYVMECYSEALAISKDAEILLETRLDFSHVVPGGFGTGDVLIVADDILWVIDLKYGFREVSAVDNSQLRLYGLGALNKVDYLYDIKTIKMIIVQPRIDNYSVEELAAKDLIRYGEEVIKPAAKLAASKQGELKPGKHCEFCKAKAICRARAEANLELASQDFSEPEMLDRTELAEIYGKLSEVENWVTHVKDYVLDQAVNHGAHYPGYKLVEGTSRRKYADEEQIINRLTELNYDESEILTEPKLVGISALGKVVGAKKVNELLGDLIIKPPGKPTLVPESDKRPALGSKASAEADFKNEDFN